jgi:putative oxidoreductase
MDIITKQGKLLFALPFAVFGIMHLMMGANMAGMVPSFIPGGVLWVYLTGIALIAAPVAILMNKMAKLASFLLGVMLLIFALSIHLVAVLGGDQMSMGNLLKDLALAGAAFMYSEQAEA